MNATVLKGTRSVVALVLFIIVAFLFFANCGDGDGKISKDIIAKDTLPPLHLDTTRGKDIGLEASLQENILFDSININAGLRHAGISIVLPVISKKTNRWIATQLDRTKKGWMKDFTELVQDDTVYEANGSMQGFHMWIEPSNVYVTDSVVSIVLKNGYGHTGMPATWQFGAINFDKRTHREIKFTDFFIVDKGDGTISLPATISQACNREDTGMVRRFLAPDYDLPFGFDKENVYFCFDRGNPFCSSVISIQRKFISHLIRKEYR
jgi:hypothetical protein